MRQALSSLSTRSAPQERAPHEVPTSIATALLEKLIADRDARAVDRVVTASRRF